MPIGFYNVICLMDRSQNMPTLSGWPEKIVERQSYKYPALMPFVMFCEISCAMKYLMNMPLAEGRIHGSVEWLAQ